MRVLFLSNEEGAGRSTSAYTHRVENLRLAIDKLGVQTEYVSLREQPIGRPLLAHPANVPFLAGKVADYDFIHAGGDAAYTAAFLKPLTRARVVHDVHGDTHAEAQLEWRYRHDLRRAYWVVQTAIMNPIAYRRSDYFLVVSKPLQRRLVDEHRISPRRIALIRNGVDLGLFQPQVREAAGVFTLCYSGGFQVWQALDSLVAAMERIPSGMARLKVIGFTERDTDLKASIASRLGAKVELLDRMPQKSLLGHWAAADMLVSPRTNHRAVEVGLPVKFSEYLAMGKPVIVTNNDETADLVTDHRCGLVSVSSAAGLADTIRAAAQLPKATLVEMGQNGRRLAETEFSWDVIGRKYLELLRRWSGTAVNSVESAEERSGLRGRPASGASELQAGSDSLLSEARHRR